MTINRNTFQRAELVLGTDTLQHIRNKKVIIFGIGGVGSWCAEALVRTGIEHLTIVDFDIVCESNINRQLMATSKTIGLKKVEVLKDRLLDINPDAKIVTIQKIYSTENFESFQLDSYDYIIDAIDTLENKIHLIQTATQTNAVFFSSMGAALKVDPTRVKTTEFWKVQGCPLAASLRRKFRGMEKPAKKFICVYSDENGKNKERDLEIESASGLADATLSKKGQANGSLVFVTATFGLTLASLVIQDIRNRTQNHE